MTLQVILMIDLIHIFKSIGASNATRRKQEMNPAIRAGTQKKHAVYYCRMTCLSHTYHDKYHDLNLEPCIVQQGITAYLNKAQKYRKQGKVTNDIMIIPMDYPNICLLGCLHNE